MRFKFAPSDSYSRPLTVNVPVEDGVAPVVVKFNMRFKRRSATENRALLAKIRDAGKTPEALQVQVDEDLDKKLLVDSVVGWDGLTDADDAPVPFSAETLSELLEMMCYRKAILAQFIADMADPEAKNTKN